MTHFIDYQFPKEISFGSSGGISFQTDIIETISGHEQRNIKWAIPKARFNVALGLRHQQDLEVVRALHFVVKGRARGFRYQDPLDHAVKDGFIGIGDGKTKVFQLIKRYQITDHHFFDRPIFCPIPETMSVFCDQQKLESNWSLGKNGQLIFKTAPKADVVIAADFHFDIPVRFDCDHLPQRLDNFEVATISDIPLVEILL